MKPSEPPRLIQRYTDLLKFLEDNPPREDEKLVKLVTRSFDGETRSALFQHPPGRLEIGPVPAGEDCVLKVGLGLSDKAWEKSDGVDFKVSVKRGEAEEVIFSHLLDPRNAGEHTWKDHEVSVPGSKQGPFSIVFETGPGPAQKLGSDLPYWSAPHVVCKVWTPEAKSRERPPVILISLDTLRQEHLGLYGYSRDTSPTLDALAQESVVFENAFSTAPYTLPSHASMFTGLYPEEHGAGHSFPEAPLAEEMTTVAEVLRDAGYRTVAVTAGGSVTSALGMDQGFEEWTERRRANLETTLPLALDTIGRQLDQPLFLFLHTYDIHAPYEQPPEHRYFVADGGGKSSPEAWQQVLRMAIHRHHELDRFSSVEEMIAAYDSGIRFVDAQLAKLFEYLKELGIYEDALIIVTSDHGEALFDRGLYFGHSHTVHDEVIRVPLIVRVPQATIRGRREELVQLVDIPPLILATAGVEPRQALSGRNPLTRADQDHPRYVRGEASIPGSVFARSRDWKVVSPTAPYYEPRTKALFQGIDERFRSGWQIFDLARDPEERVNLVESGEPLPPQVRELTRTLRAIDPPGAATETAPPPEGALAEDLRALGYIQ